MMIEGKNEFRFELRGVNKLIDDLGRFSSAIKSAAINVGLRKVMNAIKAEMGTKWILHPSHTKKRLKKARPV